MAKRAKAGGGFPLVWVLVLGLLTLAAAFVVFALSPGRDEEAEAGGVPRVEVDTETLDYGDVRFGTPIEAAFTVRNTGTGTLEILEQPYVELVQGC